MSSTRMNIVFSADDKYAEHLAVTIASILINSSKDDQFKFFILSNDFSEKSKKNIISLKRIKNFEIEFIPVDINDFKYCPEMIHLKVQAYFRLKIADLIKESKALYLDCDIIVRKSLRPLYDTNISEYIAAVVEEMCITKANSDSFFKNLDITKYFNSGVMLWNLDKAREASIEKKCFEFIKKFPEKLKYCDQCVLNSILKDSVKYLDNVYNFQYNPYKKDIYHLYKKNKQNITILHFVTEQKPWTYETKIQFRIEYCKYLIFTPWFYNCWKILLFAYKKVKLLYKYIFKFYFS